MECATNRQPFLVAVYRKQKQSETCIVIVDHIVTESQLIGAIDLNECNLDYILGNVDVSLIWCKTIYPHKDKMKAGLELDTMHQL